MTKIYESPDKGKTLYEREFGDYSKRTLSSSVMYGYSFTANAHFQSCPPDFSIMSVAQQEDYLKTKTPEEQQKIYASTTTLNLPEMKLL